MELHLPEANNGLLGAALLARIQELVLRFATYLVDEKSLAWDAGDVTIAVAIFPFWGDEHGTDDHTVIYDERQRVTVFMHSCLFKTHC